MWMAVAVAAGAIFLARPDPARATQVRIPLTIDYIAIREALKRKLYTAPRRTRSALERHRRLPVSLR